MFFENLYKKWTQRQPVWAYISLRINTNRFDWKITFFCNSYFSKCNYKLFQNSISAESSNFHRNRTACSWNIQNNAKNVWVIKKYLTKHFALGSQSACCMFISTVRCSKQSPTQRSIYIHLILLLAYSATSVLDSVFIMLQYAKNTFRTVPW